MCGIGGVQLHPGANRSITSLLDEILVSQVHRGPDASGVWVDSGSGVGFCHNRLSILDLSSSGNQPLQSSDGRYVIVFNGEIYNYRELKVDLIARGSVFMTSTDTEVILEGFRCWGEGVLLKLRGMFSFIIYDKQTKELFGARDRVGKKPFVYSEFEDGFVFASEVSAIKSVEGINKRIDHSALAAMLLHNLRHVPDPSTAYLGIKRLRPGHAIRVREGRIIKAWRYWTPMPSSRQIDVDGLRQLLVESVGLRMQADVPVGALLSGGVDSSAIVAIMQSMSTDPIHTYALGFDRDDEDLRRARLMADHLGTNHKEYYFDANEQWDVFFDLIRIYGEPIMLLPLLHTYVLCRSIRDDGVKVVLSGNGADEIFYGYNGHVRTLRVSHVLDMLRPFRSLLVPLSIAGLSWVSQAPGARKAEYYRSISRAIWAQSLSDSAIRDLSNVAAEEMSFWGALCPSTHYIDESNFIGLMVENAHSVTVSGDLPAMAASIEIRSPFLDQEMVSFALATPAEMKITHAKNTQRLKAILRDAVKDLMPPSLLSAPKRGFGAGIQEQHLFMGGWKNKVEELLMNPNTANGLFDPDRVRAIWKSFLLGRAPASAVAKQLAIQVWLQGETV